MRSQRRTKAPYSVESIERALTHHQQRGSVDGWHHYTVPSSRWVVALKDFEEIEFTDREAWALCCGLAAGVNAGRAAGIRAAGESLGPVLLRFSDPVRLQSIAAGGGPVGALERLHAYCPLCSCNKSGVPREPNPVGEACSDARCLCHDDDWKT